MDKFSIGVIAPSFIVPPIELDLGVEKLRTLEFKVKVHSQCKKKSFFYASDDETRALALYEYATRSDIQILWSARGGSGAGKLLHILDRLTAEKGIPPKKLMIGYSDVTALLEYVRVKWNWSILHAPMPGSREFFNLSKEDSFSLANLVRGEYKNLGWEKTKLKMWGEKISRSIEGELVGGNLTVWNSLVGTAYQGIACDRILFLEDLSEPPYRIDRMVQQLMDSGGFEGVKAIVLGTWEDCKDLTTRALKSVPAPKNLSRVMSRPQDKELRPLRKLFTSEKCLKQIFEVPAKKYGIPVAYGLPVGHGKSGLHPLPLGALYELKPEGRLQLTEWDWLR